MARARLLLTLAVLAACLSSAALGFSLTTPSRSSTVAWPSRHRHQQHRYQHQHQERQRRHVFVPLLSATSKSGADGLHDGPTSSSSSSSSSSSVVVSGQAAIDQLSPERRESLYRHLLRDLEIEGVPLLECDVDRAFTMQAALWLTLAQLQELVGSSSSSINGEREEASRACLILSEMPMEALRTLVEETNGLLTSVPTLSHIKLSLVGRGVGPGLILSVNGTNAVPNGYDDDLISCEDAESVSMAMNSFLNRMGSAVTLPGTDENFVKVASSADICETLAAVWNAVCELVLSQPPSIDKDGAVVLTIPYKNLPFDAFVTMTNVLSCTLQSVRATDLVDVVYCHPSYDSAAVASSSSPSYSSYGHLIEIDSDVANFGRRSPVPAIVIRKRGMSDEPVRGRVGELQAALDREMSMLK